MEIMGNPPHKVSAMRKITSPDSTNSPGSTGNSWLNISSGNPLLTSLTPKERSRGVEAIGTSSGTDPVSSESVFKVFVKLKPFPKGIKLTKQQLKLYRVVNPAIFINLEDVEQDLTKNVDVVAKKFTFSESFGADVSQVEMFERVVKQQVINLFAGKDGTVMSYGSTTSGKSYTLDGSLSNPGLIPRTLELIFSREKPVTNPNYKPRGDNTVEVLNPERKKEEIESRKKLLSSLRRENVNVFKKALRMLEEGWEFPEGVKLDPQNEIWLSFLEIRDEKYYDLLSPDYQTEHVPLKFGTNPKGETFVKDLSHLHVGSVTDARDVLTIGRNNLKKFNSKSNTKTSNSHCIFNITLLMYEEIDRPELVQMSRFSFCDLAAHQESNLDVSLLALVKSLRAYYETHPHPRPRTIDYFCPSKLTNLFKSPLTGTSSFSLITHIDPNPGVYKDTHEALHFTAISTEIVTKIRNPRFPQVTTTFGKLVVEGVEDFSHLDHLTPEQAANLAVSFQHEIAGYEALELQANININKVIIKKVIAMMVKVAGCYQKKMELLKNLQGPPEDLEKHQKLLEQLKSVFEKLQEEKESAEAALADDQEDLDEIMSDLPEEYKVNRQGKDPALVELEGEMRIKDKVELKKSLIKGLNEARVDLNALHEDFEGARLGELERKYIAAKLEKDMDSMLDRHTKKGFKNNLERVERLEGEIERAREVHEAKCEELSGEFMEIEEALFNDSGSIDEEEKKILTTPEELENTGNRVDEVSEVQTSIPGTGLLKIQEIREIESLDQIDGSGMAGDELEDESNISMEIDDSSGFKTEIVSEPQINVSTPQKALKHSKTPVAPVPEHQTAETRVVPVLKILSPESAITSRPGPSTAASSVLENGKPLENHSDSEDERLDITKSLNSHNSSVTGSSVDLQPPVLEAQDLLENLEEMTRGLDRLDPLLENLKRSNSSLERNFDVTPPNLGPALDIVNNESSPGDPEVLQVSEEITRTPLTRSRRRIHSTCPSGSLESKKLKGKERTEFLQTSGDEVSPERHSPGVRESSGANTPLRRSGRKKRRTRRFVSPFVRKTRKLINDDSKSRKQEPLCIQCDICDVSIVEGSRYHCSICSKGDFDLCPECFQKNGHDHTVEMMMI